MTLSRLATVCRQDTVRTASLPRMFPTRTRTTWWGVARLLTTSSYPGRWAANNFRPLYSVWLCNCVDHTWQCRGIPMWDTHSIDWSAVWWPDLSGDIVIPHLPPHNTPPEKCFASLIPLKIPGLDIPHKSFWCQPEDYLLQQTHKLAFYIWMGRVPSWARCGAQLNFVMIINVLINVLWSI